MAQRPLECKRADECIDMIRRQLEIIKSRKNAQESVGKHGSTGYHDCTWLRKHQQNDPSLSDIDLSSVMCSACERGQCKDCKRKSEAVELIMASKHGKRTMKRSAGQSKTYDE